MSDLDGIKYQHAGDHLTQPCQIGAHSCDIQTLLTILSEVEEWLAENYPDSDILRFVRGEPVPEAVA